METTEEWSCVELETRESLLNKIRLQVEFYLGDANLPRDNFLLRYVKKDKKGFVKLSVLATFNRLKRLSADVSTIAEALQCSDTLVLNEERTKVRRKNPLPKLPTEDITWVFNTLVVEDYPELLTVDAVKEKFSTAGDVAMVRILRRAQRTSQGVITPDMVTDSASQQPNSHEEVLASTLSLPADLQHFIREFQHGVVPRQLQGPSPAVLVEFVDEVTCLCACERLIREDGWRELGLKIAPLVSAGERHRLKRDIGNHSRREETFGRRRRATSTTEKSTQPVMRSVLGRGDDQKRRTRSHSMGVAQDFKEFHSCRPNIRTRLSCINTVSVAEVTSKRRVARGPDGTRGFGLGRGR